MLPPCQQTSIHHADRVVYCVADLHTTVLHSLGICACVLTLSRHSRIATSGVVVVVNHPALNIMQATIESRVLQTTAQVQSQELMRLLLQKTENLILSQQL